MKRYIKSSLCKYTKKECIDAIQWMFGYNKAEANQYYATANKELLESVVDVFKSNAEKSFIYDSTNIEGSSYLADRNAERIFELSPQYDSRKSFYGKAKVVVKDNGDYVLYSYDTPVATVRNGKRVPEEEYKASQTTNRHIKEFYRQFEDASTDISCQTVTASTHSASDLAKFIEESVDNLLAGTATNNQYKLDNDWAVYVGWSDAGYTDDFESVIHDENDPSWAICAKIATTHEAVWADYDFCDMPYNEETGDVWDTDMGISPEENYQQTAAWLLQQYDELIRQIESGEFVPHKYN